MITNMVKTVASGHSSLCSSVAQGVEDCGVTMADVISGVVAGVVASGIVHWSPVHPSAHTQLPDSHEPPFWHCMSACDMVLNLCTG